MVNASLRSYREAGVLEMVFECTTLRKLKVFNGVVQYLYSTGRRSFFFMRYKINAELY